MIQKYCSIVLSLIMYFKTILLAKSRIIILSPTLTPSLFNILMTWSYCIKSPQSDGIMATLKLRPPPIKNISFHRTV
jgi:hypothetical protein